MFYGNLEELAKLAKTDARLAPAAKFLAELDPTKAADGRVDILPGNAMYANIERYNSKPYAEKKYESHRRYIDIQTTLEGEEELEFLADDSALRPLAPFDESKDIVFYETVPGTRYTLRRGTFMVLFPGEPHKPGIARDDKPTAIRKLVIKIRA